MQRIIVDITPGFRMPTIYFSQGDVGTQFQIDLRSRFGNTLPASPTVTIQATKPSGFGFSVAATSVTNGVAVFTTTAEMTDEAGRFPAELKVVKDSVSLFSANFYMSGEATTHPEGTIDGQQETVIPELTQLVERVETAASSVLDMTVEAETLAAGSQATYSYDEDTNTATFGIPQGEAGAGAAGVTANAYSSSATYAVGDYVIHNSNLYRCTTAITTAESFTAAHWTQVVLGDDVSDLKSALSTLTDVHISPNLLDESNTTSGYINNSSGAISVSGDWVTTDYMPVEYGKTYTFSCTSSGARVLGYGYFRLEYDENKSAITSTYATDAITAFAPTSASTKYVRFSYHNYSYVTERCFAEGDSLSYYEYGKKTFFVKEDANSDKVKKLLSATSTTPTRNMFDIDELVDGYISNSSGAITVSGDWVTTDYFPVEYGHYYTCSNDSGRVGVYFALEVDEDKTPINYINTLTLPYTPSSATVKYLRFSVHSPATPTMVFEESKQMKSIFTPYGDELTTNKGLLYKKKWVALGDSLTEKNVSAISNYTDFISVQNHMDIVNMGVGGTGYMRGYDSSNAFYQRASSIPACDIITVFGSGNDLAYYSNLGDVTDSTTDTICGCINKTLDVIFTNHPTTPLLVIAPTPWAGNTPDMTTGMALYCEKLEAICSRRGIAYLDLFHHSGLRPNDEDQRDLVFYSGSLDGHGDYVHPNKLGHSIIAPRIMQAMESVIIF